MSQPQSNGTIKAGSPEASVRPEPTKATLQAGESNQPVAGVEQDNTTAGQGTTNQNEVQTDKNDTNSESQKPGNDARGDQQAAEKDQYIGPEISGVTAQMQKAAFWISRFPSAGDILLRQHEISAYNANHFQRLPFLSNPLEEPQTISGQELRQWIQGLSSPSSSTRYDGNGKEYKAADYEAMKQNLYLEAIPDTVNVRFGLTVNRTLMRTWATSRSSFAKATDQRNDYFVETAVYPGEPVVIYHTSRDGKWLFAGIYHYKAWLSAEDVALCTREDLEALRDEPNKLVIRGAKLFTPEAADLRVSHKQLDMGLALPLAGESVQEYAVRYPLKDESGELEYISVRLEKASNVSMGYLDYTTAGVLEQAFKFIGEPYGWGGMNNARDCTAFLVDIYRSFGIALPRNSDQQEQISGAISLKGKDHSERLKILEGLRPGSTLYMPGHAMMYLGEYQGRHYIIHDVASVYEKGQGGELKQIVLYQVAVTPLDVFNSKGTEYIMLLSTAAELQ